MIPNTRFFRLLALISLSITVQPCIAQQADQINVQFLSFPKVFDPEPIELYLGDGETFKAKAPANALSEVYRVPRMSTWAIGEMRTSDEGEERFVPFGQAKALNTDNQLILLIRKGESNADGLDVISISGNHEEFGGGKFMFINASKVGIAGDCGGAKFVIEPGERKIIRPLTDEDDERHFQATFYFRKQDEARPFWSSKWPVTDRTRGLVFFYHDPDTKQLRLHTIRDFLR